MLESGGVPCTKQNLAAMISVARDLGLESIRVSYVEIVDQYMRLGAAGYDRLTFFADTLDSSVAQLRAEGHFVSPHLVLNLVDREGIGPILASRNRVDKLMVELWITAVFTLCLDCRWEYYVRLAKDDPPDAEVLMVDKDRNALDVVGVEITRQGQYSRSVTDVIAKKFTKRYQDGTLLLVFVEESEKIFISDMDSFIQKTNSQGQRVFLMGGAGEVGKFKIVPWDEVTVRANGDETWLQMTVDTNGRTKGRCEYEGVVYEPPYMSRFPVVFPVFINAFELRR